MRVGVPSVFSVAHLHAPPLGVRRMCGGANDVELAGSFAFARLGSGDNAHAALGDALTGVSASRVGGRVGGLVQHGYHGSLCGACLHAVHGVDEQGCRLVF